MKKISFLLLLIVVAFMFSCNNEVRFQQLSERIQYDVPIKNNDVDANWWINNIVGPDREELIKGIFEKAKNGDIKVYDYFNVLLTPEDVSKIGIDTIYQTIKRNTPPYEEFDTMIVTQLNWNDITKLRFLEEWKIDPKTMNIEKTIFGIAPVKMVEVGGSMYAMPLFWIYLDEKYPAILKN